MMEKKIIWMVVSCLMIFSLVVASCGPTAKEEEEVEMGEEELVITEEDVEEEEVVEEEVVPVENVKWWEEKWGKPQYGGTITSCQRSGPTSFDPYFWILPGNYEALFMHDYTVAPEICAFQTAYNPIQYWQGNLVESWEQPDAYTLIWHIRKGIHWQDKAPVNGREFTASDVEYHYHRMLGLGSGYTKPTPYAASAALLTLESVTATDKYTVVLKWSSPVSYLSIYATIDQNAFNQPVAREAVEEWGNLQDWEHTITTSAFFLVEYVVDSSMTYDKNPNYWGYDKRYPENRLPYADRVKVLILPDVSTQLAAVRTGKIDFMEMLTWEQAESLAKTNPKLVQGRRGKDGPGLNMRTDTPPFNDIRVRKAMQMAIDLKSIANIYYGGTVDWRPTGVIGQQMTGYYTPLDEQPEEVQEAYAYNPEGAKKLLAEAGYPDGFKTNVVNGSDAELLQILVSYFSDIGVDMELRMMDSGAYRSFTRAKEHDQTVFHYSVGAVPHSPERALQKFYSTNVDNFSIVKDPVYDGLVEYVVGSMTEQEIREWTIKANDYIIANYWAVFLPPTESYGVMQPWFKGYNFQMIAAGGGATVIGYFPICWIDQN